MNRKPKKRCEECGSEMPRANKKFCSRACRNTYFNRHPKPKVKTCVVCGQTFQAQRANRMYCSASCNEKAKWARKKTRRRSNQSTSWKLRRPQILAEQDNKCWLCGEEIDGRFDCHHLEYGEHSAEAERVVALHAGCHKALHGVTASINEEGEITFHGKALDFLRRKLNG